MINCKEATRLMSEAQDRRLGFAERSGLRLHLLFCRGCANFLRQLDLMRQACRRLGGR